MNPKAETCACGSNRWQTMIGKVFWCRRCGAIRPYLEVLWQIPLDQAGHLSAAATVRIEEEEEPPTNPATPKGKSGQHKKPTE